MEQQSEQPYPLCSVCRDPMVPGQAFNGLAKSHWACAPGKHFKSISPVEFISKAALSTPSIKDEKPATVDEEIRFSWIEQYLRESKERTVDVLDSDFVCGYVIAHKAGAAIQQLGAPRCPQLGKDMGRMFRLMRLDRSPTGLPPGDSGMGFPKWVYCYALKP